MPIKVPVTQTGLEASIEAAAKSAGRKLKINLGTSAKSIEGLSQPLGRITGKADQFTKSMEAANARVLAFGASVGVLSAVTRGFQQLVTTTIDVEKRLTAINSILGGTASQLNSFKKTIFDVAKNTEQSFGTVADAALELSRQGLKAEEVTKRLNDALVLSRLSGLGASEAVAGLTAAINSFNREGVTSAEVLNKLSAAAVSAAVSERDLIEGIKRSGSVAIQAGVSLDELVGVITAVQTKTARGGAVIGNSFKTIFTRIQSIDKLQTMQNLGVQITDVSGQILSGTKLIENLAKALSDVPDARRLQIAENLVGKFQVAPFLAILDDYNSKTSKAIEVTKISQNATTEAYQRNKALSETLSTAINSTVLSVQKLAETLGKIGVTDNLKGILTFFNNLVSGLQGLLDGDSLGSKFAKGIVAGIGNVLSGPGLAIFGAIIAKLTIDLAKFGVGSLQTFFGLNKAAKEQATLQGQIASTLLGNSDIQKRILTIESSTLSVEQKRAAQTKFFTTALNEQLAVMTRMQAIAARVTPGVFAGTRGGKGRAAGGFIPNYNAVMGYGSEQADISRGVGGAPSSAKPVTIPNFNFGGGQKGTMVANNSEYMVPNFAGTGGSAIFNQEMVASMGLPSGAKKVGAAGGYIPNFAKPAKKTAKGTAKGTVRDINFAGMIVPQKVTGKRSAEAKVGNNIYKFPVFGINASREKVREEKDIKDTVVKFAVDLAKQEAKTMTGGNPTADKISKLGNQGAVGSLAGTIFETALSALLKSKDFDFGETATFDFVGQNAIRQIGDISPALAGSPVRFLEAKIASNSKTNLSMANKIRRYFGDTASGATMTQRGRTELLNAGGGKNLTVGSMGMTKTLTGMSAAKSRIGMNFGNRGASGYIPSFAGPLQEAVARETAAGLPINQVRINQDSSLRNGTNPMGLAVTNTRDEPTGAIPNFAKGGKSSSGEAQDVMGGLVGKMLAVQIGMSALSGILGEVTEKNTLVSGSLTALNIAVSAALVASSFGGFGKVARGIGSFATGGLGRNVIGKGQGIVQRGVDASRTSKLIAGGSNAGMMARKGVGLQVTGALTKVGGALLRFAGPVGAAAAAAYGVSKAMDYISGRTERAANMQEELADSAATASRKLNALKVPQEVKEEVAKKAAARAKLEAEQLGAGIAAERGSMFSMEGAGNLLFDIGDWINPFTDLGNFMGRFGGNIKGTQDEKFEGGFQEQIKQSLEQGLSSSVISRERTALEATRKKGDQFDSEAIEDFVDTLKTLTKNLNVEKTTNQISGSLTGEQIRSILEVSRKTKEAEELGVAVPADVLKAKAKNKSAIISASRAKNEDGSLKFEGADLVEEEILLAATREKVLSQGTKLQKIEQIRADIAKEAISAAINLAKLRSNFLSSEEIILKKSQTRNNLDAKRKVELQEIVGIQKIEKQTNSGIADEIDKQVQNTKSLVFDREKQQNIITSIQGLSLEQLGTEEKAREVVAEILDLDGKLNAEQEIAVNQIVQRIKKLREVEGVNKNILKQNKLIEKFEAERVESLNIRTRQLNRETLDRGRVREADSESALRNLQFRRDSINPNISDAAKTRINTEITKEEEVIKLEDSKAKAVEATRKSLSELRPKLDGFTGQIDNLINTLDEKGFDGITGIEGFLSRVATGEQKATPVKIPLTGRINKLIGRDFLPTEFKKPELTRTNKEDIKDAVSDSGQRRRETEGVEEAGKLRVRVAEQQEEFVGSFKRYSQLLIEFTQSLRQQAEQLKMDLVTARDGGSILSNVNEQLFAAKARGGGAGAIAQASTDAAITGLQDQAFLAGTGAGSRGFTRQIPILKEQLDLKKQFVELQTDENAKAEDLEALKEKILNLEKERLQVNDSLGAMLEDEFIKTPEEINKSYNESLVGSARKFADTLSEGLTNAIAKGESLGDTLKSAAAEFFLEQSKNNFKTAMDKGLSAFGLNTLNAGGKVTGGSGVKDDVPALLTGGEYVINRKSVDKYGVNFMSSLNKGSIPTMNKGGLMEGSLNEAFMRNAKKVPRGQHGRGNIFTPGTFGKGEIKGKGNLLDFATQSFTTGQFDKVSGGSGFASIGLEPQSAALTMFGRRNSPQFKREQDSKKKAFGLYVNQVNKEKEFEESQTSLGDVLKGAVKSFLISAAVKGLASRAANAASFGKVGEDGIGRAMPLNEDGTQMNFLQRMMLTPPKKATGGSIPYAAGVDTVPAMLSGGEFVMNAAATQRVGRGTLSSINSGGGADDNGAVVGKLDELISVSENSGETTINITVNSDGTSDESGNGDDQDSNLALKIRDVVRQVISDEQRLGGSLRKAKA